jgi:diguanylate cyclase (GGDEF)-like protein
MRENMAAFFSTQLDFIFFFYGLAFLLLGAISFGVVGGGPRSASWIALGSFGYAHGLLEWGDLLALVIGDGVVFTALRIALLTASFLLLLEFGRLEARPRRAPIGRWVHAPLALGVALVGVAFGLPSANAATRYAIGFLAGANAAFVFASQAKALPEGSRRYARIAAAAFALYGAATGLIVAPAPFWPADRLNSEWFAATTGTPIQLVRGLLACVIAFSIWTIHQNQLAIEVSSARYSAYLRRQFGWMLASMAAILLSGWLLTNFLGGVYERNIQAETRSDLELLASRFLGDTRALEATAKTLAGSRPVEASAEAGAGDPSARAALKLHVAASGADRGLILDATGRLIEAAGPGAEAALAAAGRDYARRRCFTDAIGGGAGRCLVFDPERRSVEYRASEPIRGADSERIVGVAVLAKSLDGLDAELERFDHPYFLIDSDGMVVMTNRRDLLLRPMWPAPAERRAKVEGRQVATGGPPVLKRELLQSSWATLDGKRGFLLRKSVGPEGWSLAISTPTQEVFASRVLGIIVTLLVALMTLIYLVGQERRLHDGIQMDKRLRLQELARDLGQQAVTDPLTGLFNRLKFDRVLACEMQRSRRYGAPLSLVLFDIDHFKNINDAFGHQIGDKTLMRLSNATKTMVRKSDLLARWGGEEFVLLTPGSDGEMAERAAEKLRAAIEKIAFEDVGPVTCSFGVTQYAEDDTAAELVSRADQALYLAKINGRNRVETVLATDEPARG